MKKVLLLAGVAMAMSAALVAPSQAAPYFFDDFESGFGAWTVGVGSGLTWTDDVTDPSNKVVVQGQTAASNYVVFSAPLHVGLTFSWRFYDPGAATNVRHYLQIRSYVDAPSFTGLQELLALGSYNSGGVSTSQYSGRSAFGGANWFTHDAARSAGWHDMSIVITGGEGTGGAGKGLASYIVDGVAVDNVAFTWKEFNMIVVGSGLSSALPGDYQYDDIKVVPEPASLIALGAGLVSMVGLARRRR